MSPTYRTFIGAACLSLSLACANPRAWAADVDEKRAAERPVDVVIALDTSNSMDNLIDAARRKLWDLVNELAKAKPSPRLRVALISYGNTGYSAERGWVSVDSAFTDDLDTIYQRLFALRTNGGDEYVARAIQVATDELSWSSSADALKLIFVAGNEPANQDPRVDVREACRRAIGKGIMVNSIYCGPATSFEAPLWREVATLADGHFASIDIQNGVVEISTPFDQKLAALSTALNATYIPIGAEGHAGQANQAAQDANASGASSAAAAGRAQAKASALYRCRWDLVDKCLEKDFRIEDVKDEDLPESLRKLSLEERKAHVASLRTKRESIQKEIDGVNAERRAWLDAEQKKSGGKNEAAFDEAVKKAIRAQAEKKGFGFAG